MAHTSEMPIGEGRGQGRRFLIVASSGGGGDLQPLLALAVGLQARGHHVAAFGDTTACAAMARLGVGTTAAGPQHDLAAQLDPHVAAERIADRLVAWSERLAPLVEGAAENQGTEVLVTSLFGAMATHLAATRRGLPWAAVNSTFYIGPDPPRPPELDFGSRAALFRDFFAPSLDRATLALHASDRGFDLSFDRLPVHHRYVGPLLWDPPEVERPPWLDAPGPPWALVTLSSHMQDDLPIAHAALAALRDLPLRVLLTLGKHSGQDLGPPPANARVERHVSHGLALGRSALMVGHAGHGSVMRALWHGVPMVLVPWGRDQSGVAYRAERLGVAAVVPRGELTAEQLSTAVRRVLGDRALAKRAAAVSARLRVQDPMQTACSLLASL
jgi:UDP:flavonoid glycosyltransferase YjiC (YdhE family)